jgi:hypothetical protein
MSDVDKIILAFNQGFRDIHDRLDDIQRTCASRQVACFGRMSDIEKAAAVKEAVCDVQQEEGDRRKDPWRWIVRGMATAVGSAAMIWIILMIVEHINLLMKAVSK